MREPLPARTKRTPGVGQGGGLGNDDHLPLLRGLCDDAALFPPGNASLAEAIPAHAAYLQADYDALVGPFVFPAPRLSELAAYVSADSPVTLSLTVPAGPSDTAAALSNALAIPGVHVAAVEVGIPDGLDADAAFEELSRVHAAHPDVDIFVEVPRGDRRAGYLTALETAGHSAKFRTGGIVAEAYPNEEELADAVISVVRANIPFKATAGLHHVCATPIRKQASSNTASSTSWWPSTRRGGAPIVRKLLLHCLSAMENRSRKPWPTSPRTRPARCVADSSRSVPAASRTL